MLDLLYLILIGFLASKIRNLARRKGLNAFLWVVLMLIAWLFAGSIGSLFGMSYLGIDIMSIKQVKDLTALPVNDQLILLLFNLFFAFGGFLLIQYILEKKPDLPEKKDIDAIGAEDLQPPSKR